jgi:hypothetical protein
VLGLAGVAAIDAGAQSAVARCDRLCLTALLDDYLEALAAHDPSPLPLAPDVIFTENGRLLELGEGAWRTVGARLGYRDDLLDPETGGAAALTAFREADGVVQYFVRLAVTDRRITEIESIAVRASDVRWFAAENLEGLSDLFMTPVQPAERLSRDELVAGARAYFAAIETEGTPEFVQAPFARGMNRIENGLQTTNAQKAVYYGFEMNARGVLYDYLNYDNRMLFKRFDATGVEIGVALAGTLNDRDDTDTGWTLEVAIPWENFEPLSRRVPAPGTVWEANLNRWDGVEPDRRMSIWSDPMNNKSWPHVPSRFGELVFVD